MQRQWPLPILFVLNGYTYKSFGSRPKPEFAVFVSGTDSEAVKYANLLAISLGSIKQYYDEKNMIAAILSKM